MLLKTSCIPGLGETQRVLYEVSQGSQSSFIIKQLDDCLIKIPSELPSHLLRDSA
jgi:hypothetical protein